MPVGVSLTFLFSEKRHFGHLSTLGRITSLFNFGVPDF